MHVGVCVCVCVYKGQKDETEFVNGFCLLQEHSSWRLRCLESLRAFVSHCTEELIWLNEKEEEELAFDWSENNTNMAAKREQYAVSDRNRRSTSCIKCMKNISYRSVRTTAMNNIKDFLYCLKKIKTCLHATHLQQKSVVLNISHSDLIAM